MKTKLQEILKKIIKELYSIENSEIILENPPKKDLWDFAFWPFLLAKELKKSPIEIWKEIIEELKKYPEITDVAQAWPYINIKLDKSIFTEIFLQDYKYFSEKTVFTDWEGKIIKNFDLELFLIHIFETGELFFESWLWLLSFGEMRRNCKRML